MKKCEKIVGQGVKFEHIRRITGYLTGDTARWNTPKLAELRDRKINFMKQEDKHNAK